MITRVRMFVWRGIRCDVILTDQNGIRSGAAAGFMQCKQNVVDCIVFSRVLKVIFILSVVIHLLLNQRIVAIGWNPDDDNEEQEVSKPVIDTIVHKRSFKNKSVKAMMVSSLSASGNSTSEAISFLLSNRKAEKFSISGDYRGHFFFLFKQWRILPH
jgi:hypothetical protein